MQVKTQLRKRRFFLISYLRGKSKIADRLNLSKVEVTVSEGKIFQNLQIEVKKASRKLGC